MTGKANQPMLIQPLFPPSPIPIYTIGYGERTVAALVAVLQRYHVQRETILHHLAAFVQAGQSLPVARLQAESTLSNEQQRQIFGHFAALGAERLRPIFEAMAEQVSYDELHLLRAIYKLMQV